ncbi:MAG: hypothetical protein AAGA62_18460, partial [Bacteroidota bacterium]
MERPAYEVAFDKLSAGGFEKSQAKAYVKKWHRETEFINRVLAKIPLEAQVEETEDKLYTLDFDYVSSVSLDTVTGGEGYELVRQDPIPPFGYRMVVKINDLGQYRLHLSDSTKALAVATTQVDLDNLLSGTITESGDRVLFSIQGGKPPYQLAFLRDDRRVNDYDLGDRTTWSTTKDSLREIIGEAGIYGFQLTDAQRNISNDFAGTIIEIPKEVKTPTSPLWPSLAGGGIVLAGLLLLLRNRRKKRRRSRIKEQLAEDNSVINQPMPAPAVAPIASNGSLKQAGAAAITSSVHREMPREAARPAPGAFRVTRREKVDSTTTPFNPDVRPHDFLPLALQRNWTEGRVSTILFSKP